MKTLITPAEVVAMAFEPVEVFSQTAVTEAAILTAEHKFIRPLLGKTLYDLLYSPMYTDFVTEYLKPPLALLVKWLLLPSLSVQSGQMGVVQIRSANFMPADPQALAAARSRLKADAHALLRCAVEHLEQYPWKYPQYRDERGGTVAGGIVFCDETAG